MMRVILLFCLLLALPAYAAPADTLPDPVQESRAVALGNEIRCVVCQSETINDSQADAARDLRRVVREKILSGWSDGQIFDYLCGRYGDFILLKPPVQPNTYLLWLAPFFFLGAGAVMAAIFFRRRRKL